MKGEGGVKKKGPFRGPFFTPPSGPVCWPFPDTPKVAIPRPLLAVALDHSRAGEDLTWGGRRGILVATEDTDVAGVIEDMVLRLERLASSVCGVDHAERALAFFEVSNYTGVERQQQRLAVSLMGPKAKVALGKAVDGLAAALSGTRLKASGSLLGEDDVYRVGSEHSCPSCHSPGLLVKIRSDDPLFTGNTRAEDAEGRRFMFSSPFGSEAFTVDSRRFWCPSCGAHCGEAFTGALTISAAKEIVAVTPWIDGNEVPHCRVWERS